MEYLRGARQNCEEALKHIQQLSDVNKDTQKYELLGYIQDLFSEIEAVEP